jgi:hypothetical protein
LGGSGVRPGRSGIALVKNCSDQKLLWSGIALVCGIGLCESCPICQDGGVTDMTSLRALKVGDREGGTNGHIALPANGVDATVSVLAMHKGAETRNRHGGTFKPRLGIDNFKILFPAVDRNGSKWGSFHGLALRFGGNKTVQSAARFRNLNQWTLKTGEICALPSA